jgi:hypothetical protein
MMLVDTPMALLAQLRRQLPPEPPDESTVARLRAVMAELDPDPLFRRRLRGRLLNNYVAVHEGMRPAPPSVSRRGKVGRAALYAGLTVAIGATAVGAASRDALPGDPLYGAKMAIEQLQMELAPAGVKSALHAASVEERLDELAQLAARGDWTHAAASTRQVAAELQGIQAAGGAPTAEQDRIAHRLAVLTVVFEAAPPAARDGLQRAIVAPSQAPAQQPSVIVDAVHSPATVASPHAERTPRPERATKPASSDH